MSEYKGHRVEEELANDSNGHELAKNSGSESSDTTDSANVKEANEDDDQHNNELSRSNTSNYLKRYPYLYVRETDQTDYYCTLCDTFLKEEELQNHLFLGHQAESFEDYFVRVQAEATSKGYFLQRRFLYVCVVCWTKVASLDDTMSHRQKCKPEEHLSQELMFKRRKHIPPKTSECDSSPEVIVDLDTRELKKRGIDAIVNAVAASSSSSPFSSSSSSSKMATTTTNMTSGLSCRRGRKKQANPSHLVFRSMESLLPSKPSLTQSEATFMLNCPLCSILMAPSDAESHLRDFHRMAGFGLQMRMDCCLCNDKVLVFELASHMQKQHKLDNEKASQAALLMWLMSHSKEEERRSNIYDTNDTANVALNGAMSSTSVGSNVSVMATKSALAVSESSDVRRSVSNHNVFDNLALSTKINGNGMSDVISTSSSSSGLPTVLESLLTNHKDRSSTLPALPPHFPSLHPTPLSSLTPMSTTSASTLVPLCTRTFVASDGKESVQCLVCAKWFAVPPIKHLRGHLTAFKESQQTLVPLLDGRLVCIGCAQVFDNLATATNHVVNCHPLPLAPNPYARGTLANTASPIFDRSVVDKVLMMTQPTPPTPPAASSAGNGQQTSSKRSLSPSLSAAAAPLPASKRQRRGRSNANVELDNAGRVKSGKVRKQCELCGEWSNIKWFFKHMAEVHQALFCRCCREYLPTHEHEEHKRWHAQPPYMGQKIRIENGKPVIIDRKERASLTPIGSLAAWGGSSGGMVVKAVDADGNKFVPAVNKNKRSNNKSANSLNCSTTLSSPRSDSGENNLEIVEEAVPKSNKNLEENFMEPNKTTKDTLMPKETCPVCGIQITYKNLARHIKLRHKINNNFKFCHKCRKLVPTDTFEEHKALCEDTNAILNESNNVSNASSVVESESPNANNAEEEEMNVENDAFSTSTSKTKLDSLMGKEFKHPRRRCAICGYTVSYSNFKRHVRNAHPNEYRECGENNDKLMKLGQPQMDDGDEDEDNNDNDDEDAEDEDEVEDDEATSRHPEDENESQDIDDIDDIVDDVVNNDVDDDDDDEIDNCTNASDENDEEEEKCREVIAKRLRSHHK